MKFTVQKIIIGILIGLLLFLVGAYDKAYSDFQDQSLEIDDEIQVMDLSDVWQNIKKTATQVGEEGQNISVSRAVMPLETPKQPKLIVGTIIKNEGWRRYLDTIEAPTDVKDWILRIVLCESSGNPLLKNSTPVIYQLNGKTYTEYATGLGQFLISTWNRGEGYLGRDMDIWNEYDQIDMMVEFYKRGQQSEWSCN